MVIVKIGSDQGLTEVTSLFFGTLQWHKPTHKCLQVVANLGEITIITGEAYIAFGVVMALA